MDNVPGGMEFHNLTILIKVEKPRRSVISY